MSTMFGLLLPGILRRRWLAKNVQLSPGFALADSSDGTDSPGLPAVTLRMAITKAIESRRISGELKAELRQIRSTLPRRV